MKKNTGFLLIGLLFLITFILTNGSSCSNVVNPGGNTKGSEFSVEVRDFGFKPDQLVIKTGDTVTWINVGAVVHTATSDNGTEIGSTDISPGTSFSHTFDMPGTYDYHCSYYSFMKGAIIVQ